MSDSDVVTQKTIPVTVLTGFLGSGKTTILLSLMKQLNQEIEGYKVCVLKNEFGDVEVDSLLASEGSIAGVSEITNGCMCCVMVGQMKTAILEIREKYNPDRILIESSGSAFPATLAWQVRELARETEGGFELDGVITVIDAVNFTGYEDTSPTAKLQAQYTDLIIVNKWELVTERQLDTVMDHLYTLNDETPKLRHSESSPISPRVCFGLDSQLFQKAGEDLIGEGEHNNEVEVVAINRPESSEIPHVHSDSCKHGHDKETSIPSTDTFVAPPKPICWEPLETFLATLPKSIYRVKGLLLLAHPPAPSSSVTPFSGEALKPTRTLSPSDVPNGPELYILNWAFGRSTLTPVKGKTKEIKGAKDVGVRLSVMGERGEVKRLARKIEAKIDEILS